jgi:hypothetical protein
MYERMYAGVRVVCSQSDCDLIDLYYIECDADGELESKLNAGRRSAH